ncbi:hypothetical protein PUNSTDRAFT_41419 [Punctularia strigosozonata HHB-11173 SS5]|uniref:uncharacterized protein n=1 Tax=Punctularia strigosozonata (strain HHB-11173) TaxID=741275 RepID=UPI0004416CCD|nr:uncharacterized protein PUNSTDRAFT_41419 [Punctularia strigosozonata HHB-11173 SS5]EIN14093.1 hypothetical protein PUNSTDRAFT_41419 [Punctularia strigosozonata HHB-11173 SS5]
MTSFPGFLELPAELVTNILHELDVASMLTTARVCSLLRDLIAGSTALQYKIELKRLGMVHFSGGLTAAQCKERLQAYQTAWDSLKWNEECAIPMSPAPMTWELQGGVLAQAENHTSFSFSRLPAPTRGISTLEWRIDDVDVEARDFTIDCSQDLLIIVEEAVHVGTVLEIVWVHFRTMSTGKKHPHALSESKVSHRLGVIPDFGVSYELAVYGDYVAVQFRAPRRGSSWITRSPSELVVWNWKTGNMHFSISGAELRAFSFINDTYILLGLLQHPQIDSEPSLMILDMNKTAADKTSANPVPLHELQHHIALFLPPLIQSADCVEIRIRSDPVIPTYATPFDRQPPFTVDPSDRLFVVSFWIQDDLEANGYTLFLPLSTIIPYAALLSRSKRRTVEWSMWGPDGTRLIPMPELQSNVWVCYVHGMRYVVRGGRLERHNSFTIYNFKRRHLRSHDHTEYDSPTIQTMPTIISDMHTFEDSVITRLPYWTSSTTLVPDGNPSALPPVLLTEDALVFVHQNVGHE